MPRPRGHRLSPHAWDDALVRAGLTLTEVAERSGIPRSTLSALLGGHSRASMTTARQIALVLTCRPETLFPTLNPSFVEAVA